MSWRVEFRPEVEADVAEALNWYELRQPGLGAEFVEEIIRAWSTLSDAPLLMCRRHPTKDIRWRFPDRFPYRIVYQVDEVRGSVLVIAVLHAARDDSHWRARSS